MGEVMYKIYQSGLEFYNENEIYILQDELKNHFLYVNSNKILKSDKENFCIKVYDSNDSLYLIKYQQHPLFITGSINLLNEGINILKENNYIFEKIIIPHDLNKKLLEIYPNAKLIFNTNLMLFKGQPKEDNHVRLVDGTSDALLNFIRHFYLEVTNESFSIDKIKERMNSKLYGYFVDDQLVSIIGFSRETKNYITLNYAYTNPIYRNKGYIKKLILSCAKVIIDNNKKPILFVDKNNPISNKVYKQIGFKNYYEFYSYKI